MSFKLAELPWLLRMSADDVRRSIRELPAAEQIAAGSLVRFANQYLDTDQLMAFARTLTKVRSRIVGPELSELRLVVLSSSTTDYLVPGLIATGIRHGLQLDVSCSAFGQVVQEALSRDGLLQSAAPEAVLVALDRHFLGLVDSCADESQAAARVDSAVGLIRTIVESIKSNYSVTVLLQTIPIPADPWLGHLDRKVEGSLATQVARVNEAIVKIAQDTKSVLIDVDQLSALVGRSTWTDNNQWFLAKLSVAMECLPLYADHIVRTLAAMRGKSKKCLVLDLDNTLWGGVIADDGLGGIILGQGSVDGEAFLAIQQYALELKKRGVILAVCSKNDEHNARLPFENHPEMLLKPDDIAVFVANWTDKATNLREIAKALNIGIDSLVFLDDNPAERAFVRQEAPEVSVPEVSDDPSLYPTLIAQAGYFESISFTNEDLMRSDQYLQNAKRVSALKSSEGLQDFLLSLDMVCEIKKFDAVGRARITQLINKSNQFNLTTRRYTESQTEETEVSDQRIGLQIRLVDRFGDNGMISVIVIDKHPSQWTFDTWLMSCRVLGREVENAVLKVVIDLARQENVKSLVGIYIPTPKNSMVKDHYRKLGFTSTISDIDGADRWELDLTDYRNEIRLPMELRGIVEQPKSN